MAVSLLRHRSHSSGLANFVRQSQMIRVVKYSSNSDDPEKDKKKLSNLLSQMKQTKPMPPVDPRLARPNRAKAPQRDLTGKQIAAKKPHANVNIEGMDSDELLSATKSVAGLATTAGKQRRTESDLLKKLKTIEADVASAKETSEVTGTQTKSPLSGMKFEREPKHENVSDRQQQQRDRDPRQQLGGASRQQQQRQQQLGGRVALSLEQQVFLEQMREKRRQRREQRTPEERVPIDIFGGPGLGVFTEPLQTNNAVAVEDDSLKIWKKCTERELRIMSTPAPRNRLEEFIELTNQGKLWHFPVDNEQGLDYSHEPFHQHVFLENQLEDWCPKAGPVRHFMELVCLGLSKNPYTSAEYKRDTIQWFRDYFEQSEVTESLVHQGLWHVETSNQPTQ